jgi:glycerol-3-phosphate dehydrogenase
MAVTLGDVLIRRTRLAFESPDQGRSLAPVAARLAATLPSWVAVNIGSALEEYEVEVLSVFPSPR